MRWNWIVLASLGIVALPGCATQRTPSVAQDLAELASYNKRYLQSINDGDIATLSSLTAEEHISDPAGTRSHRGQGGERRGEWPQLRAHQI